jgi:rod shape-determining protein MreD
MNPANGGWLILLSVLAAMVLGVLHLPETWPAWLGWWRPAWVAMVVFYWVMALPNRLGLITAWLLGFFVDALNAEPLGLNGFLLAAITYITWRFYERLRMYSVFQQCGVVFLLVLGCELLRTFLADLTYGSGMSWGIFGPAFTSMLLWPFLFLLLDRLRASVRVE